MRKDTTTKKTRQKPEVSNLDVKNTASGERPSATESTSTYVASS